MVCSGLQVSNVRDKVRKKKDLYLFSGGNVKQSFLALFVQR